MAIFMIEPDISQLLSTVPSGMLSPPEELLRMDEHLTSSVCARALL